jgi:hypothetical protein
MAADAVHKDERWSRTNTFEGQPVLNGIHSIAPHVSTSHKPLRSMQSGAVQILL